MTSVVQRVVDHIKFPYEVITPEANLDTGNHILTLYYPSDPFTPFIDQWTEGTERTKKLSLSEIYKKYFDTLIFRGNVGYLKFKLINARYENRKFILTFKYVVVNYKSCFDILPLEVNVRILSKILKIPDVNSFLAVLGDIANTDIFNNTWKLIAGKYYFDPRYMKVVDHPLITNLFDEYKYLGQPLKPNDEFLIHDSTDKIYFENKISNGEIQRRVVIYKNNFDIYAPSGKVPRGSLYDEPYHGFDVIDGWGVIVNNSKHKIRIEDIKAGKTHIKLI